MEWIYSDFEKKLDFHEMVFVEGGTFWMGSEDPEAFDDEKPVHERTIAPFFIGKYVVTQAVWEAVMGENPSNFIGPRRPVENVSWDGLKPFLEKLKQQTDHNFRRPSEAEWEFAARGGKHSEGYKYAGSDWLKDVGWFEENNDKETSDVGLLYPNELGLFDMSGNVWEWCEDDWIDNYNNPRKDGLPRILEPKRGVNRVVRGGGWGNTARGCRTSYRNNGGPGGRNYGIGFRLACSPRLNG